MSEQTKLIKKAVFTGVGATTNVDRIKSALNDAAHDLARAGHDLIDDLENKGKDKAESVQIFLRDLQDKATKKTSEVSSKVQCSVKKAVKDFGLATHQELEEISDRLAAIEETINGSEELDAEGKKTRGRPKKSHN